MTVAVGNHDVVTSAMCEVKLTFSGGLYLLRSVGRVTDQNLGALACYTN